MMFSTQRPQFSEDKNSYKPAPNCFTAINSTPSMAWYFPISQNKCGECRLVRKNEKFPKIFLEKGASFCRLLVLIFSTQRTPEWCEEVRTHWFGREYLVLLKGEDTRSKSYNAAVDYTDESKLESWGGSVPSAVTSKERNRQAWRPGHCLRSRTQGNPIRTQPD